MTAAHRLLLADLAGRPQGLTLDAEAAASVMTRGHRLPLSALAPGLADGTGIARPTGRAPLTLPGGDTALPVWMFETDGRACPLDPRHALAAIVSRYAAIEWAPLVETRLTFSLAAPDDGTVLAPDTLRTIDAFLGDLDTACAAAGIAAGTARAEAGSDRFTLPLDHGDALRAADDLWLARLLIADLAPCHGLDAAFGPGLPLRLGFSIMTEDEENLFDELRASGETRRTLAIGGVLAALPAAASVLAPGARSFAASAWGYGTAPAALCVSRGASFARRLTLHAASASANPYLALALLLGAALDGIDRATLPPAPLTEGATPAPPHPIDPGLFGSAPEIARILPTRLRRTLGDLVMRNDAAGAAPFPADPA